LRLACGDDVNDVKGKVDLKKVKEVLSQYPSLLNEDLNGNGYTPLIYASLHNCISIVEFLLSCDDIEVNKGNKV
jgi:ankyrin repeat protein